MLITQPAVAVVEVDTRQQLLRRTMILRVTNRLHHPRHLNILTIIKEVEVARGRLLKAM